MQMVILAIAKSQKVATNHVPEGQTAGGLKR
jgi:hypothetical protein